MHYSALPPVHPYKPPSPSKLGSPVLLVFSCQGFPHICILFSEGEAVPRCATRNGGVQLSADPGPERALPDPGVRVRQ